MANTAQQLYVQTILALPEAERLRLAALILNDLARQDPDISVSENSASESPGFSAAWSEQDQTDIAASSLRHAAELYPEGEDLVG